MKQITLYKCEICNTEYNSPINARECEKFHIAPVTDQPISKLFYSPMKQGNTPYPYRVIVKFNDGKTVEYKR